MSTPILSDAGLQTKRCSKCKRDLPLSNFCKNRTKKDGYETWCKECTAESKRNYEQANKDKVAERKRKHYRANKEKIVEHKRKYRQEHKDTYAEYQRNYYQANKEKIAEGQHNYRQLHKEKYIGYCYKYRQSHKDKIAERNRKWNLANPEFHKVSEHKRRARKRNTSGSHTARDVQDLFSLQKGKCAICHVAIKTGYHIDHIIPLANNGSNDKYNLQLLCGPCNQRKHAKDPITFMQQQGFLL